jgi:hypothetical protein
MTKMKKKIPDGGSCSQFFYLKKNPKPMIITCPSLQGSIIIIIWKILIIPNKKIKNKSSLER